MWQIDNEWFGDDVWMIIKIYEELKLSNPDNDFRMVVKLKKHGMVHIKMWVK